MNITNLIMFPCLIVQYRHIVRLRRIISTIPSDQIQLENAFIPIPVRMPTLLHIYKLL